MLILGDCRDWYAISNWRWMWSGGGIQEFVNDMDGPAFLERELMGLDVNIFLNRVQDPS